MSPSPQMFLIHPLFLQPQAGSRVKGQTTLKAHSKAPKPCSLCTGGQQSLGTVYRGKGGCTSQELSLALSYAVWDCRQEVPTPPESLVGSPDCISRWLECSPPWAASASSVTLISGNNVLLMKRAACLPSTLQLSIFPFNSRGTEVCQGKISFSAFSF